MAIAQSLISSDYAITYSVAGIVRHPKLNCRIISGGFHIQQTASGTKQFENGTEGLCWHLQEQSYDLVIDATHPYAIQISEHAVKAAQQTNTVLWRYLRPAWEMTGENNWQEFATLNDIIAEIKSYTMPFFTVGREVFSKTDLRYSEQQWLVRSAGIQSVKSRNITELKSIGPFEFDDELALFKRYAVDALISKNSGGNAVAAKLAVAAQLEIPVFLLQRPAKAPLEHCFSSTSQIIEQIKCHFPA